MRPANKASGPASGPIIELDISIYNVEWQNRRRPFFTAQGMLGYDVGSRPAQVAWRHGRSEHMRIEVVSAGATAGHNEDWAGHVHSDGVTDLVVIDGGTSVADRDYVAPGTGDVVWFVSQFAAALGRCIDAGLGQHAAVHAAIESTSGAYRELAAGQDVPAYAWPIAALTWTRITRTDAGHRAQLYCLGDCKTLLRDAGGGVVDLDPFVNPQEGVLRAEIARLRAEGIVDGPERHARLLPLLRARRAFQNTAEGPAALCLRPNGDFQARTVDASLPPGATVLGMTDGFYRLVDTYALHTPESLAALCVERGLQPALSQLRSFEQDAQAKAAAAGSVKRADDASAILWQADSPAL